MTAAARPRRQRRGLSVHTAPAAAALVPGLAGVALAGVALTTLTPVADIEVLRAVTGRADVTAVIDRIAQADAAVATAYRATLALAIAMIVMALGLYVFCRRAIAQSLQRLADSVVETSRTDDTTTVWGRDRADPLGVIARTVEVMQWERLRAVQTAQAAETQGREEQAQALNGAAAKADRIQDALTRSVTVVSKTCSDFHGVLDRAEKALNLASNAAWDGATAQRDQMNDAIQAIRVITDELAAAAAARIPTTADGSGAPNVGDADGAPSSNTQAPHTTRAYHATLVHVPGAAAPSEDDAEALGDNDAPAGLPHAATVDLDVAIATLRDMTATLSRETEASVDAARAITAQAAIFASDAEAAARHTAALAQALDSADAHAERLAGDADSLAERVTTHLTALEEAATPPATVPSSESDTRAEDERLTGLLTTAQDLVARLVAAREHPPLDASINADTDPRLEDAIARLEALMATFSAAIADTPPPLGVDAIDTALARRLEPVAGRLDTVAETLAEAPAALSVDTLDAALAALTRPIAARLDAVAEALANVGEGVRTLRSRPLGVTPEQLDAFRSDLEVIKTFSGSFDDSLTAAARGLTSHAASVADQAAAKTAERVTQHMKTAQSSVSDAVSSAVRAATPTSGDVAEELERRLSARLAPLARLDALAAQVKLVEDRLAALSAPAEPTLAEDTVRRLSANLESRLETALEGLQAVTDKLDAVHQDATPDDAEGTAPEAPPSFDAERSSFRRMAVAFELVLRDVNGHAARLAEAVGRVETGVAPSPAPNDQQPMLDALGAALADVEARLTQAVLDARGDDTAVVEHPTPVADDDAPTDAPLYDAGRDSFQRLVVGFRHVLRELGDQAEALRGVVDAARAPSAPTAQPTPPALEGEVLPPSTAPAPENDDDRHAGALEPFAADRTSMQRIVVGFRHTLRRLDDETHALHEAVETLKGGASDVPAGASLANFEERLAELTRAVQTAAANTVDAAPPQPRDTAPSDVLRAIDRLSARAATLNEAVARQGEVLRTVIDDASDELGPKAEQLVERLERAARDARAHTTEFLAIAAAFSRDLDETRESSWDEDPAPTQNAAIAARAKRRISMRRRVS